MKTIKILILAFSMFLHNMMYSQSSVFVGFNSSYSTINLSAGYLYQSGKNEIGFGVRRNISEVAHRDDLMHPLKRRLFRRRESPIENWGLHLFYNRKLPKLFEQIDLFLFYDFQTTYASTRNVWYEPTGKYLDNNMLYRQVVERHGPYTWIEQNVGVGFEFAISEKVLAFQKIGIGNALVIGNSIMKQRQNLPYIYSDFAILWSLGLKYNI
jgi:hypothetical protein